MTGATTEAPRAHAGKIELDGNTFRIVPTFDVIRRVEEAAGPIIVLEHALSAALARPIWVTDRDESGREVRRHAEPFRMVDLVPLVEALLSGQGAWPSRAFVEDAILRMGAMKAMQQAEDVVRRLLLGAEAWDALVEEGGADRPPEPGGTDGSPGVTG